MIVSGLWAKVAVFWQKNYGRLLKLNFTCRQQNFEKKWIGVNSIIIIFLGPWMSFFLILTKKLIRCVETVIEMYRRKTSLKKDLEHLIYRHFWTWTRKTCIVNGKFFAGLSNLLFTCPEEHLQSSVSERKSWKLKDFRINFEIFGTMVKNIFQGWQNSNRFPGEQFMEKFFSQEEISLFFPILSGFFLLQAKTFARFAKSAVYSCLEVFMEKHFLKFIKTFTLLWILIQRTLSRKNFLPGCHNCNSRV